MSSDPSEALRIYLNHDVGHPTAKALRREGFDVVAAEELGHEAWSDEEQLIFAAQERRAIFSFNVRDFSPLHAQWLAQGKEHWGILLSPQVSVKERIARLRALLAIATAEELRNQVRWI